MHLPLPLVKSRMSYIETIPFKYNSKEYVLLVQPKKKLSYIDYHVTAVTNDVESKLYVGFVFRWENRKLTLLDKPSDNNSVDFINSLRQTIYDQIILKKAP
jgi:hypothetical protein